MAQSCSCSCNSLVFAATRGHVACVRRFHQDSLPSMADLVQALACACSKGNLECIKFLVGCGGQVDSFSVFWLIYRGRLPCVQFLHEHGIPWTPNVMSEAAMSGDVQMMTYIYEHMSPTEQEGAFLNPEATYYAAKNLECLKYALSHGCLWHPATMMRAAEGHLDCLQYCYEQGTDWSARTTSAAAWLAADCENYCACLVFLVERGCLISTSDCYITKNRVVIAQAMRRRRAAKVIQLAWLAKKRATACRAVSVIEDAYIKWTCRPGAGQWYQRALLSFCCNAS